ncbi:hypothetical protein [Burkholderia seminalis]|uniref:hypothetical protein n=1 Tax=Burkholderia seminalis TaxID=488731 RepID=UPI00114C8756|nr:hypothetical protein [Burkholderia seminalis]
MKRLSCDGLLSWFVVAERCRDGFFRAYPGRHGPVDLRGRDDAPHGFREYIEMIVTRTGQSGGRPRLNVSQRTRMPPIDEMNIRYTRS